MKSNFSQRLTAVFLLLCMLFSLAPATAEGSDLHAYCYGFNVTKDASDKPTGFSFKIGAQFGTAPYTLNWAVSGAASVSGSASNAATITLPGSFATGEYTFTVNAQDAAGAQKTAVMKVSYTVDEAFNCSQSILSSVNPQTVKVSKIQLDQTSLTLKSQEYVQLIHTVEPANAANRDVLWSSSNAGVVDVDQSGRIQTLREGTAVITCTAKDGSGVYATCAVTVAQRVVNLTLNTNAITVGVGGTYKLVPTIIPDNAANKEVTFTSSNNTVVVVANDGTVTGVSNGVAAVTAASKENPATMATCIVTVGTPVETITVSPKAVELTTGTSLTLSATVAPATATNKTLVWASSDTAVATVDQSGRVSVWKAGSATITVRAVDGSGAQDTCAVTATGNDVTPPTTNPPSTETTTPPSTETTTPPSTSNPLQPPAGTWTMYVDTVEGGLNLRNNANQGATRLLVIPRHAAVSVVTYGPTWCYVWYNGTSGYVMTKFLSSSIGSGTQTTPPSSGNTYAYVVTETGRLNLRTNKNQNAGIIAKIEPGESVRIIDHGSTWSKVSYNGKVGFVMSKFLSFTAPETTTPPPSTDTTTPPPSTDTTTPPPSTETTTPPPSTEMYGRVTTEQGRLNLRTNKNLNAGIIAKIEPGEYVKVLEYGATWCRVTYNGRAGYVMTKFLTFGAAEETTTPPPSTENTTPPPADTTTPPSTETTTPPATETTTPPPSTETTTPPPLSSSTYAYVVTPTGRLNMRSSRSQNAGIIARIDPGTQIKVLDYGATWCKINYNGRAGFVMTKFLSTTKPEIATPSTETTTPPSTETTRPPESTGSTKYAQVVTEQGSLNMRYSQSVASALITRIPQNAYVQVLSTGSTWCRVTYGGHTGYVMTKFLSFAKHEPSSEGNQTVLVKSSGKMYKEASTGSAVLAEVVAGDYIVIYDDNGTWAHALHLGKIGYVKSTCLTLPEGTAMQSGVSVYADRTYSFENDSAVVGTLNAGDKVQILHCYGDTWWKVRMSNGTVGYVVCKTEVLKVPNW